MVVFLPLTVFYFVVVLFNINVTGSHLHGYVFCCQGIAIPALACLMLVDTLEQKEKQFAVRMMGSLFSVWNLEFEA